LEVAQSKLCKIMLVHNYHNKDMVVLQQIIQHNPHLHSIKIPKNKTQDWSFSRFKFNNMVTHSVHIHTSLRRRLLNIKLQKNKLIFGNNLANNLLNHKLVMKNQNLKLTNKSGRLKLLLL
jgi:hypothetical protein